MRLVSIGSYAYLLGPQLVDHLRKDLEACPCWNRCDLVGGMWFCWRGCATGGEFLDFRRLCQSQSFSLLFLLPVDQNVKLSVTVPVQCLSAPCCDDHELTLEHYNQVTNQVLYFYKSCFGYCVFAQQLKSN